MTQNGEEKSQVAQTKTDDPSRGAIVQRDGELFAIAPHIPCGVTTPEFLRKLADVAETYGAKALKVTGAQRIAIVGIKEEDVDNAWRDIGSDPGRPIGLCVRSIKACPGTTFCKRGQQDSLGLGLELDKKYHGMELPNKFKMGVSGCPMNCADSPVRDIGITGRRNGWSLAVGGCVGPVPRIGQSLVDSLNTEDVLNLVEAIVQFFKEHAERRDRLGRLIDRIGFDAFEKAVLGK